MKSVSIIGLGLIGGSIAKALRNVKDNFHISAYDIEEVLSLAFSDGVIDNKLYAVEDALASDVIFICLPIGEALKTFNKIAPNLKSGQILTDVCSVKSVFADLWVQSDSEGIYIGGHPMTGKEKSGYQNSDPLLFENSIYILTENLDRQHHLQSFRELIESLGANILYIPPKQHDVIAASVSHLPQLVSVALVNTSSLKTNSYNFLDLAAGGFRDMTRIASSDFEIWESIIKENRDEILSAIEKFSFEIEKLKKFIYKDRMSELRHYFNDARKHRDEIPKNTKGFLSPLFDLYIFVKDEPGVISKISTALYRHNINIKDIELLKIREGAGGTFRISFESKADAAQAQIILEETGFRTSLS
ncbi:MAG: prephenate dehydrogenase/arogenate dehydrogenase family protein [Melioribacteraceae bacterium]|nr:prephenate dehydrogenase/arogenate dehydrogenase family protein [Melioribacteraceae bacterium]